MTITEEFKIIPDPFQIAQVISQYKVTLPTKIRKDLNLKIGDYLRFTTDGDQVIIEKVK